jgi:hypothetical protein
LTIGTSITCLSELKLSSENGKTHKIPGSSDDLLDLRFNLSVKSADCEIQFSASLTVSTIVLIRDGFMSHSLAKPVEVESIRGDGQFHYDREYGFAISDDEMGDEWAGGEYSESIGDDFGDHLILGSVHLSVLPLSDAHVSSTA